MARKKVKSSTGKATKASSSSIKAKGVLKNTAVGKGNGVSISINGKVMTAAQKAKEEERRLKEYISTRSYNQLQERSEDIAERIEEVRKEEKRREKKTTRKNKTRIKVKLRYYHIHTKYTLSTH